MQSSKLIIFALTGFLAATLSCAAYAQQKHAFVVGVENYNPEYFKNLDFAEDDATALAAQLESMDYQVTLMTSQQRNPQHKPTTPKKILRLFDGVLQSIEKDDVLIVSFSGHGIQFKSDEELEGGGRETYFVPEEGSLDEKETLLPIVSEIVSRVDTCKAERKLILIDACRNEVLSSAADKSSNKIDLGNVHENARVVPKGMTLLFSCSSGQKSWETKELKHSVFSSFVLKYLSGKLDEEHYTDRKADVSGLVDYVRRQTNRYVIKNISSSGQYPKLIGDNEQWPIGTVGPRAAFTNSIGMQLRLIPAGKFTMGSPDDEKNRGPNETQHEVEITQPFFMAIHEVTVEQYRQFVEETDRDVTGNSYGFDEESKRIRVGDDYSFANPGWEQADDHPAVCVSWRDAEAFCRWLSIKDDRIYRLPTEAEWEYACRAGSTTTYNFVDGDTEVHASANVAAQLKWVEDTEPEDGFIFTAPVGSFKPNAFGLFDMHGNVSEWCSDFYAKDYYENSEEKDPQGPSDGSGRVLRGGSFTMNAKWARSASRSDNNSDSRYFTFGIRVVCEID